MAHRRARLILVTAAAVIGTAFIAGAVLRSLPSGNDGYQLPGAVPAQRDYHDPLQLAEAVKEHYRADSASCGKISTGSYTCFAYSDGAAASYAITVSADGRSWHAA